MARTRAGTQTPRRTDVIHQVLFVDDDVNVLAASLRAFANCNFNLKTATSAKEALDALQSGDTFAVIVSDMKMPGMDGIKFLQKSIDLCPDVVRIMLTGCDEQATAVDAINAAEVFQFLTKPCSNEDLRSAIEKGIEKFEKAERRRAQTQSLEEMAYLDELTGIFNRRSLFQQAEDEFERARRFERPFTIALVDVDHFKRVNDTYGHIAGDAVLRQMAGILGAILRDRDILGRYGGEELMIAFVEADSGQVAMIADRLREKIEKASFDTSVGVLNCTVSIGVASFCSSDASLQDIVERADKALYRAKDQGRNRVQIDRP